jgi:hypothetical protein
MKFISLTLVAALGVLSPAMTASAFQTLCGNLFLEQRLIMIFGM